MKRSKAFSPSKFQKCLVFCSLLLFMAGAKAQTSNTVRKVKTQNKYTPYIYHNGYKDYTVKMVPDLADPALQINELKFNCTGSAFYSQEVLYAKFGKWTSSFPAVKGELVQLVWDKVQLFKDSAQLFTITASGNENEKEIYASIRVVDAQGNDCLAEGSNLKKPLLHFFTQGMLNLTKDNQLYEVYKQEFRK